MWSGLILCRFTVLGSSSSFDCIFLNENTTHLSKATQVINFIGVFILVSYFLFIE